MELNRLMISAAVAAALVSSAQAADILEEVVVTAQKREQSIHDVPMIRLYNARLHTPWDETSPTTMPRIPR